MSKYKIAVPNISHLTVQTYTSSGKYNTMSIVKEGKVGGVSTTHDSNITRDRGSNKKDKFIGFTKNDSELGDKESKVFGRATMESRSNGLYSKYKSGFSSNNISDKGFDHDMDDSLVY
jgi:hypothetical protein